MKHVQSEGSSSLLTHVASKDPMDELTKKLKLSSTAFVQSMKNRTEETKG